MEITYGSKVMNKQGKFLGTVDYLIHNSWSDEISTFMVRVQTLEKPLFILVQDVKKTHRNGGFSKKYGRGIGSLVKSNNERIYQIE